MLQENNPKHSKLNILRVVLAIIFAVVTSGMIYQLYSALHSPIKTISAIPGNGNEGVTLTAIAIREETALTLPGAGYTILARDGARLEKGAAWAAAFKSREQEAAYRQLQECEILRERLLALQGSTLTGLSTQKLEAEISGLFLDFLDSTADGTLAHEPDAAAALSEKWGVLSALSSGESDYVGKKISALKKEINQLTQKTKSGKKLNTPVSGIYISAADGMEDSGKMATRIALAGSVMENENGKAKNAPLTVAEIEKLIAQKATTSGHSGGKLVSGFIWYFAAAVPAEEAQLLSAGSSYHAILEQLGGKRITLTLESIGVQKGSQIPLVFSCSAQDEQILRLRVTQLRVILKEDDGLRIPRSAIHVLDGETGVFVRIGNKIRFRRALVRCAGEDYVIVRALSQAELESLNPDTPPANRSAIAMREQQISEDATAAGKKRPPSVQRYDEVIVEGRNLEKKIVKQ
ncbi:MAG: hypothetical protein LBJ12_07465 [Oscillospiraceae bacterium]|jgi:hypothetical protein|nr:hypothetical protein [Oscillospiraceae bacterium]